MNSVSPVSKLSEIYRYISPKDFAGNLANYDVTPSGLVPNKSEEVTGDIVPFLQGLVVETSNNGAASNADIIDSVTAYLAGASTDVVKEFTKRFLCISDTPVPFNSDIQKLKNFKLSTLMNGSGERVECSTYMIGTQKVNINLRNTNDIMTFSRAIPTHEMSRCVPHLRVRFLYPSDSSGRNPDGKLLSPGILKFLRGGVSISDRSADLAMTDPTLRLSADSELGLTGAAAIRGSSNGGGMDMFLMPQTLQNFEETGLVDGRFNSVIDPTRPFMSLEELSVKCVTQQAGMGQYKTAELSLVLHDRSRLPDIAHLIKPDAYGKTMLDIEYGWSHPDGIGSDNIYGEFINRIKSREIYMIRNAGYGITNTGEMKITLHLAMKGATEMLRSRISQFDYEKDLRVLTNTISELRRALNLSVPGDPRVTQILDAAERGERPADSANFQKELDGLLSALRSGSYARKGTDGASASIAGSAAQKLADKLKELYLNPDPGNTKSKLTFKESRQKIAVETIRKKFVQCETGIDPFFPDPADKEKYPAFAYSLDTYNKGTKDDPNGRNSIVSFGKLFCTFALGSIRDTLKEEIDEIQVFFYPFSTGAGRASGSPIGMFPIETSVIDRIMQDRAQKTMNADMSVYDFLNLVNDKIFSDPRTFAYGLSDLYMPRTADEKEAQLNTKVVKDYPALSRALDERLNQFGGTFKAPVIKIIPETFPKRLGQYAVDPNRLILRLHVFDVQADANDAAMSVLKSLSLSPTAFVPGASSQDDSVKQFIENFKTATANLVGLGFKDISINQSSVGKQNFLSVDGNPELIKAAITKLLPTISIGGNASIVTNIQLSPQQNALISSANMRANGGGPGFRPNGSAAGGLPLSVIPGEMSLSTLGCTWATIGQRIFVDLKTGTQLDNAYVCTGIDHKIGPGKFETNWKFAWYDAYPAYTSFVRSMQQVNRLLEKASA